MNGLQFWISRRVLLGHQRHQQHPRSFWPIRHASVHSAQWLCLALSQWVSCWGEMLTAATTVHKYSTTFQNTHTLRNRQTHFAITEKDTHTHCARLWTVASCCAQHSHISARIALCIFNEMLPRTFFAWQILMCISVSTHNSTHNSTTTHSFLMINFPFI